ncbi:GDSL-type esterase/lipase family protein [Salinispora cortesiana]|uniref:GDSL-type esterase/lipase family protein n=1 Tax=Salinispora cortesiana TaxID=1305843 RepID=UPI00040645D7|nr:GDSL-type esterase/lipase family protein [Salinispora cortesiana]
MINTHHPTPHSPLRVCVLGDSLVLGVGDPEQSGWVGRLMPLAADRGIDLTLYNLGIRAQTADLISARLPECMARLPHPPDGRIIISSGVNDTDLVEGLPRLTDVDAGRSLACALRSATAHDVAVAVVGPTPVVDEAHRQRVRSLNTVFAAVTAQAGVPYVDVFAALSTTPRWADDLIDGYHPGPTGYQLLARAAWAGGLADWLSSSPVTTAAIPAPAAAEADSQAPQSRRVLVDELARHQRRVETVLKMLTAAGERATLHPTEQARLIATGHFRDYSGELGWTAREIAGHLRDSALIFTERIRLLSSGRPDITLSNFDPLDADRVATYAAVDWGDLLDDLAAAQQDLRHAVRACPSATWAVTGRRPNGATISLGEILRFLPGHQDEHATQLEMIVAARCLRP